MKTMSKILATILLVVLCVSLFTVQAFAVTHDETHKDVSHFEKEDPTCTSAGHEAYSKCNVCGQLFDDSGSWIDAIPEIPATGHTEGDPKGDATCYQAGYYTCSVCGQKVTTDPKTNHANRTEVPATVGADCLTNGTIQYWTCDDCGAPLDAGGNILSSSEIQSGPKGEHTWGAWTEIKPATATNGGTEARYCSVCGAEQTRTTPATGVPAADDDIWPVIAERDTYYRGEELPQFRSDLIKKLNTASGSKSNWVGVRIGTDKSMYANSYATLDFWSWDQYIQLGENMMKNLDAGTYYLWVYNTENPEEHTNSIPFYVVDVPTLEPINTDKHVVNSTKNLRFRASEPIKPNSVKVGGKTLLDDNYYYVSNDGLTITLSPDFLNERQPGTYTISANTVANGTKVPCPFYILSTASASASPKTGDESQLGLWAAFLLLSGAAVVVLVPKIRKHGA